jgi:hypothetical protein
MQCFVALMRASMNNDDKRCTAAQRKQRRCGEAGVAWQYIKVVNTPLDTASNPKRER